MAIVKPIYKRILLKLSGEALMGDQDFGIDPAMIQRLSADVVALSQSGLQLAIVIGGGNIFRGAGLAEAGTDRVTGDHMGMLATVINSLALQDAIEKAGAPTRVMSAMAMNDVCEEYIRRRAVRHLEKGRITIFAAGTGNPFFTTDSAASLRASEIDADLLIKATKVDGVYDSDPATNPNATMYNTLTYDEAIIQKLGVMDATALVMCRDNDIPMRICNIFQHDVIAEIVSGGNIGTLVTRDKK